MLYQTPQPLELMSPELIPSAEVLDAGRNVATNNQYVRHKSDIFPTHSSVDMEGELGVYIGRVPNGNPLRRVITGLTLAHSLYFEEYRKAGFEPVEPISRGMRATVLQQHIGACIAAGYDNVVARTNSPSTAIDAIKRHIERRDQDSLAAYEHELDYRIYLLAALDRPNPKYPVTAHYSKINGISVFPVIDSQSQSNDLPVSSESLRLDRVAYNVEQIRIVRRRIKRLRFEYMSAVGITRILEEAVANQPNE